MCCWITEKRGKREKTRMKGGCGRLKKIMLLFSWFRYMDLRDGL